MAFAYAGNMCSGKPPILQDFDTGVACYVGQLLIEDANFYGHVMPIATAAGTPDTDQPIIGACVGVVNDPLYSQTYQGDYNTYDNAIAAVVANENQGPAKVKVAIARPGDIYEAPVVKDTIGTALDVVTNTTTEAAGTTLTTASGTDYQEGYATLYCRTGANRGLYRVLTTISATSKVVTVPFPYVLTENDTFVIAQLKLGRSIMLPDSQFQAIDGDVATGGNYYNIFCHKMDLSTAGAEKAWITFNPSHLWYGTTP